MSFYVRDPLPQFDDDHTAYPTRQAAMRVATVRGPTTYVSQRPPDTSPRAENDQPTMKGG